MIILADENIDHLIIETIQEMDIEIQSIYFTNRGITDAEIATLSLYPPKIILTEDKDFGEMIFKEKATGLSVIFLRYAYKDLLLIIEMIKKLLSEQTDNLMNHFTTVTIHKIRSRKL